VTRRSAVAKFVVAYAAAAGVYWLAAAMLDANPVYSVLLFVPFSMLGTKIAFRKWPVAGVPWKPPWKGVLRPADGDDDLDPEIAMRLRIVNLCFLVATGLMLVMAVIEIVRSAVRA